MLVALAFLMAPPSAHADDCLITVDKDIRDPAPAIFVNCSVKGERLDTAKGIQIETPDGDGGTEKTINPFGDQRQIWRDLLAPPSDASGTPGAAGTTVVIGLGDPSGKGRRGTCKIDDYTYKEPTRRSCSIKLEGNTEATEVEVVARLNKRGESVFRVITSGEGFTADEEALVDVAVTDKEGNSLGKGGLTIRRSRATAQIALTDSRAKLLEDAASDSALWDGWKYSVLAADGKTSLVSGTTDIDPDILDGTVNVSLSVDDDAALELDVRGGADRDQDISELQLTLCNDCSETVVIEADFEVVFRSGLAAKGTGDPLGNSWTITSTGTDEDGKVVAGPYKVTVTGIEGRTEGSRNIKGGRLRKDGIAWRLGRGSKRTDWSKWDDAELVPRTRVSAHRWTHVVVANGKSSLSIGGEQWRDQRLRADLSTAGDAAAKALLEIFSAEDFSGSIGTTFELLDSAGKSVTKQKGKDGVVKDPSGGRWDWDKAYTWP